MSRNYALRLQYEGVYAEIAYYESLEDSEEKLARLDVLYQQAEDLLKMIKETK